MAMIVFGLTLLLCGFVKCEGPDNHGREFIIPFLENSIYRGTDPNDLEIFLTTVSNTPADVNLTTPIYDDSFFQNVLVTRGSIYKVLVDYQLRGISTQLAYKTLYIVSSEEIVVYCVNKETYSTDAFVAVPTETFGREYYVMTYYKVPEFVIAGIFNNTSVSVTFNTPQSSSISVYYDGRTYEDGETLDLVLNRFQIFHCQETGGTYDDFTGTYIIASQPIAVVSGNKKSPVPTSGSSSDHLTEMLFPVECWGKEFYSYSTPDRSIGDIMRIIASEDNTVVNIVHGGGNIVLHLNAGQFEEYDVSTGNVMTITSDKGIMIGLFSKTFQNDGPNYGDPAFSLLIPAPLCTSDYTYSTIELPSGAAFNNKISVVIHENNTAGLRLDEENITLSWSEIPGSGGFLVGWLYVTNGSHNIYHTDPSKIFMAIATGTENFNSYAFSAGQRMTQINRPCNATVNVTAGDILDNDCDGAIDEETLNGFDDDGDGLIDEDLALPPRINGNWGEWGNWSGCSVTCMQAGTRARTRPCDNPAPENNGIYCVGPGTEYLACDYSNSSCGVWGVWSDWSPCSVTCNEGVQVRERNCTDVVTGLPDECYGDYNQTIVCDVGPLQGVCYNNMSGICSHCDWGYTGAACNQCMANFTGCQCEFCKADLIGYDTNCSISCYHGYASVQGGDTCQCHLNSSMGYWQDNVCSTCLDGFAAPECINCDTGWYGPDHCSVPCSNGTFAYDYDGTAETDEIFPHFSCLEQVGGGNNMSGYFYRAWMGYSSYNSRVITIPVGTNNQVDGGVANDQETEFRPGYHQYVFTIGPFQLGDNVTKTWSLGNPNNGSLYNASVPLGNETICPVNEPRSKPNLLNVTSYSAVGYCQCNPGDFGASCTYQCPGGSPTPCSSHGPCRVTDGVCICQSRWAGGVYDYQLYTEGFVSKDNTYSCDTCTSGWYGSDCSTAKLNYSSNSTDNSTDSFFVGAVASSGVITLDGATLEVARPGVYRLLQFNQTVIDGFFVPCEGRHDCHSLKEVAVSYGNVTLSVAVNSQGQTGINASFAGTTDFPYTYEGDNITVTYTVNNVVRIKLAGDVELVITNVNGELMTGVIVPVNVTVDGLLGNADGDWVNDVSSQTVASYTPSDLSASAKATYLESNYKIDPSTSVLVQYDAATEMTSGGHALQFNSSTTANVSGLTFGSTSEIAFDVWAKIPSPMDNVTVNVVTVDTSLGPLRLNVLQGLLTVDWGVNETLVTGIQLTNDWTHLALSWNSVNGTLTLQAKPGEASAPALVETYAEFFNGSTIDSITSVSFGGGGNNSVDMYLDYFRLYDKARTQNDILSDYQSYSDVLGTNQRLLVLFDEGGDSSTFQTKITDANGVSSAAVGTINSGSWSYSSAPFTDILTVSELPVMLAETDAVSACTSELNRDMFNTNCVGFDSVRQMIMENCISDYIRTNNSDIVRLSGSVFAHYCQAITQVDPCQFTGFLDFCVSQATTTSETGSSGSSSGGGGGGSVIIYAAAGAGVVALAALAACCCCCLKAIIGRKKIRDDDDEEEEEEEEEEKPKEPLPNQDQMPPPENLPTAKVPGTGSSLPLETSAAPAFTASAKAAMVSEAFLTMRERGKTSLEPEKPFEPLHPGRWTGYGWLPGARPVDGVSSVPPDELPDGTPGSGATSPTPNGGISTSGPPDTPAPDAGEEGPQRSTVRTPNGTAPLNRVTTDSSITISIDSSCEPGNMTPVQGPGN